MIKKNIINNDSDIKKLQNLFMILDQKIKYTDHDFPPNIQSLISGYSDYKGQWDRIKFEEIDHFKFPEIKMFSNFSKNSIKFGKIKNINFLNIISVLIYRPEIIKRIFEIEKINENVYAIWLFIGGCWELMFLDCLFPFLGNNKKVFSFTYSENNDEEIELYISLLEKAYAKLLGSYYRLLYPNPIYSLQNFTGLPFEKLPLFNIKSLWKKIKENINKNNFVVCNIRDENGTERLFYIEKYYEEPLLKLIKVKNGFWEFNWDGDFSFLSEKWTQELKNKLEYIYNDQEYFWITVEDFQKNFDEVITYKYFPNYYYNSITINKKENFQNSKNFYQNSSNLKENTILKMDLKKDTHIFLTLFQKDARICSENYTYSYFRINIGKIEENKIEYIYSKFSCKRNIVFEQLLKKGEYIIMIEPNWQNNKKIEFSIGSYSSSIIFFEECHFFKKKDYNRFEIIFWISFSELFPDQMIDKYKSKIINSDFEINEYFNEDLGIFLYQLKNLSDTQIIKQLYEISIEGYDTPNKKCFLKSRRNNRSNNRK